MFAQTHLYPAFELFTSIIVVGLAGMAIGVGSLLASIGAKATWRSVVLIATLPVIGPSVFTGIGVATKRLDWAAGISIIGMLGIAVTAYYWPEKPTG